MITLAKETVFAWLFVNKFKKNMCEFLLNFGQWFALWLATSDYIWGDIRIMILIHDTYLNSPYSDYNAGEILVTFPSEFLTLIKHQKPRLSARLISKN